MNPLVLEPELVSCVGNEKSSGDPTAAAYLLRQLAAWGVKRIYGVIGDSLFELLDALAKQDAIQYVACRHEESAALMASAEAKLTGGIGVCMATSGPGIANLLNGLADAAMDCAPVVAITGQVPTAELGAPVKQYIDQQRLIDPIAYSSRLVASADALPRLLPLVLTEAVTNGAVTHLSVPKDIWTKLPKQPAVQPYMPHLHQSVHAPDELIREAARLLTQANRPVLYFGRGVEPIVEQVKELAVRLSAAVVTTIPARPLFPNDNPQYAGGLGPGGSEASSTLMADSDLIVTLGATWWPQAYVPAETKLVQIDCNPQAIGLHQQVQLGIVADLRHVVPRLLEELGKQPDRSRWLRHVQEETQRWNKRLDKEAGVGEGAGTSDEGLPLQPQRVIHAIADAASPHAVISVDTGDHTLWFGRSFRAKPGQHVLVSGHWRTLGFALPAAIASALAHPERQAIAIAGDGGAIQTLLELQTASQFGAEVCLIIMENGCYAMEKNRMEQAGQEPLGSSLVNPDFVRIAEACGCYARRVEKEDELEHALREALLQRKPALIAVRTADTAVPTSAS